MDNNDPQKIDLKKYLGEWNEIASFPAWFQKGCTNTKAKYTDKKDFIEVDNSCLKNGNLSERKGKAFPTEESNLLKVQFFPLIKAPYRIEYVDSDYQHAIVGSGKQYLWFLSRKSQISDKKFTELTKIAQQKGYDTTKLQKTIRN